MCQYYIIVKFCKTELQSILHNFKIWGCGTNWIASGLCPLAGFCECGHEL